MRYLIGLHVTLDIDGFEPDVDGLARQLEAAQQAGESLDQLVAQDLAFTLCQTCRDDFVKNPIGRTTSHSHRDLGLVQ
jgi:hypothetical protein